MLWVFGVKKLHGSVLFQSVLVQLFENQLFFTPAAQLCFVHTQQAPTLVPSNLQLSPGPLFHHLFTVCPGPSIRPLYHTLPLTILFKTSNPLPPIEVYPFLLTFSHSAYYLI